MKRAHNRELEALLAAPALASPDDVKASLLRVGNVSASTLLASCCTGADLVKIIAADRAFAVELARAATRAREIAKIFHRVAGIFFDGAERTAVALQVRPDRVEILAEAH